MPIHFNKVEQVLELALDLDQKARYRVVRKLIPTLDAWQIEELLASVEDILEKVLVEEEALEQRAKFVYKQISNNHYAYIQHWGEEQYINFYIGPIRFLPGKKYKLTHKKTGEVQTFFGLGLYRDGEQVYMKLKYLSPIEQEQSYLFYDRTLRFPRRPQEEGIEPLFSKKIWKIEVISELSQEIEDKEQVDIEQPTVEPKLLPAKEERRPRKTIPLLEKVEQQRAPQRKNKAVVRVKRKFFSQIETYLEQWELLSQAIPSNPQWKLVRYAEGLALCNQAQEVVVELNTSSQLLTAHSTHALLTWLQEMMLAVASSKLVNEQQKTVATGWLPKLSCAPLEDNNRLLAHLLNL